METLINIYIIEDNLMHKKVIMNKLEDYSNNSDFAKFNIVDIQNHIDFYHNLYVFPILSTDIFIIDIDLNTFFTGIQLAQKIRALHPYAYIIFLTGDSSNGIKVINDQIKPLAYLLKQDLQETVLNQEFYFILNQVEKNIIFYFISKDYKQSEEFKIMAHLLSHNTQQEGAKKYLHSIVDYSADILGSKYYLELTKITATPVIAVLSTFSEKATNLQIDIALTVNRPLYYVNMDLIDFIRCLNILLNNAFESVQEQPNSFIQVIFENNEKYLSLIIKNPDISTIPLKKIMKKGFSSKSNHSGKGLYIVSKIYNNYNNVHFAIHRINGIFTTTLTIHY